MIDAMRCCRCGDTWPEMRLGWQIDWSRNASNCGEWAPKAWRATQECSDGDAKARRNNGMTGLVQRGTTEMPKIFKMNIKYKTFRCMHNCVSAKARNFFAQRLDNAT